MTSWLVTLMGALALGCAPASGVSGPADPGAPTRPLPAVASVLAPGWEPALDDERPDEVAGHRHGASPTGPDHAGHGPKPAQGPGAGEARCPMHSEVRGAPGAQCERCGMTLRPPGAAR